MHTVARNAGCPSPVRRMPPPSVNNGCTPAAASTSPPATATTGPHRTVRATASAHDLGARTKQNAKGATEPTNDRRLSASVNPGYSPCDKPAPAMMRKAHAGFHGSQRPPQRAAHTNAKPISAALTRAMVD